MLDTHELAWAAGFFDGEGHCSFSAYVHKGRNNPIRKIRVSVAQALYNNEHTSGTLERFKKAVLDVGSIYDVKISSNSKLPQQSYTVNNFEDAQAVIALLWKYLSTTKRKQIAAAFSKYNNFKLPSPCGR